MKSALQMQQSRLDRATAGLRSSDAKRDIARADKQIIDLTSRLQGAVRNTLTREAEGLARYDRLLESYSYRNVLKRGFAVVRDSAGNLIGKSADIIAGEGYDLEMGDGVTRVTAGAGVDVKPASDTGGTGDAANTETSSEPATAKTEKPARPKPAKKKNPSPKDDDRQGSLL
jgi:exodeoxyribonuclease VII large subunit